MASIVIMLLFSICGILTIVTIQWMKLCIGLPIGDVYIYTIYRFHFCYKHEYVENKLNMADWSKLLILMYDDHG